MLGVIKVATLSMYLFNSILICLNFGIVYNRRFDRSQNLHYMLSQNKVFYLYLILRLIPIYKEQLLTIDPSRILNSLTPPAVPSCIAPLTTFLNAV